VKPLLVAVLALAAAQTPYAPPVLPAIAVTKLVGSLRAAQEHTASVWRDTVPINGDGTINGYVEIARGDRRKWEFDIAKNTRAIDRMIPEDVGGYPINYGFVPQTVSYDGDPFDILVLGPPIDGGTLVRGIPVGVMFMADEKGLDSKVVVSPPDDRGRPRYQITSSVQAEVSAFFRRYKRHDPKTWSRVLGWGSANEAAALVHLTHAFFTECRAPAVEDCRVTPVKR
jgi:inorganic pyrophosphatase